MSDFDTFCADNNITLTFVAGNRAKLYGADDWRRKKRAWTATLHYQGRQMSVPYFTGDTDPTVADVLACLLSDAQAGAQSFEDFCSEFGHDPNSRRERATWQACKRYGKQLGALLLTAYEKAAVAAQDH